MRSAEPVDARGRPHARPRRTIGPGCALERVGRGGGVKLVFRRSRRRSTSPRRRADVVASSSAATARCCARLRGCSAPASRRSASTSAASASWRRSRATSSTSGSRASSPASYVAVELPTLEVELDGERRVAVNDVVAASATVGRMVELAWSVGGEDLGRGPCDGIICATPPGSTAYNLSNGGPVLVWGLDAMAVTFIAPHSLHARPIVVPRGLDVDVRNETPDVAATVLVDGQPLGELAAGRAGRRSASASSAACSRRCPRRRSSAATATRSRR